MKKFVVCRQRIRCSKEGFEIGQIALEVGRQPDRCLSRPPRFISRRIAPGAIRAALWRHGGELAIAAQARRLLLARQRYPPVLLMRRR